MESFDKKTIVALTKAWNIIPLTFIDYNIYSKYI